MISSDCLSESEKSADECSPMFDLSTNSTADLSSSRDNHTPRRKLSLCSTSSSPGVLTASDKRCQTPDSHGIKFRALNFSTEESPYLQYRSGHCFTKDPNLQQKNESSPAKKTRSKRCREIASPNRSEECEAVKDERIRAMDDCFSHLRQIPGCSPLLPSPAENAHLDAIPEASLHFDRKLVRPVLTAPSSQVVFPENLPEETTSFSNASSHFAFSSTPVHSQTSRTFIPFSVPFHLPDASPEMGGSQLLFTPERCAPLKNPTGGSEINRDDPAFEHARRNLFQAYVPKLLCETNSCFKDLMPDSPEGGAVFKTRTPSSGYVSRTGSVLSSSGSSGSTSSSAVEKMDFAEAKEFSDGGEVDCESGEQVDMEGFGNEEPALQGLGFGGEQLSLIGDFSRPYALPLVRSRNQDLKAVSSDTMADIMAGCYDDVIDLCQVIDCRYPYEFKGGHIKGAKNIYEEKDLVREFFKDSTLRSQFESTKRSILVFHCEFSSERAPKLLRFLRKTDRDINAYPCLCYPEAYILEGGYRAFFESHSLLCEPTSYVPMLQSDYSDDLKKFRAKSRSYQDECGKRLMKKRCATMNY